jgi:tetratricopeptide (TPR) repeat protein
MAIKSIKSGTALRRGMIIILAVLSVVFSYFATKWLFANTIALRADYKEIAEFAVGLAPDDPQTHFSYAVLLAKTFAPEDLPKSLAEYEKAASLSPHDYNLWLELGKARERGGDTNGAELALRKSLELAPNYARVQWAFGNFLLRQGRTEEAFQQIRRAAESDSQYSNSAVASAWQVFGGDVLQIRQFIGASDNLKAAFAGLLAREKRFEEAVELWSSLPENLRQSIYKSSGDEIYREMLQARKYRSALQMLQKLTESEKSFEIGKITNGGFESENPQNPGVFEWQIADGTEPQIGVDNIHKHGGNLSLVLVFNNTDGKVFRSVSQTVAVESGKKYEFEAFYRSDLKAAATLRWEIADALDGKILAVTEAVSAKSEWTNLKTEFTSPPNSEAVIIRLARAGCNTLFCPISGRIWFDDLSLK